MNNLAKIKTSVTISLDTKSRLESIDKEMQDPLRKAKEQGQINPCDWWMHGPEDEERGYSM